MKKFYLDIIICNYGPMYDFNINDEGEEHINILIKPNNYIDDIISDNDFMDLLEDNNVEYNGLLNSNYEINIIGDKDYVIDFINTSNIKNKKIAIHHETNSLFGINDYDYINYLCDNLNSIDDIYVHAEGNIKPKPILLYKNTIEKIESMANKVRKHDFSPIEQLTYIFDLVRDKKYIDEEEGDTYENSRDLSNVLYGEKIVCLGYAEIYDKICKKLGFTSSVFICISLDGDAGHAINSVYIKDDKYNIDGVYFFDCANESRFDESNEYLNRYILFLKQYDSIMSIYKNAGSNYETNIDVMLKMISDKNNIDSQKIFFVDEISRTLINQNLCNENDIFDLAKEDGPLSSTELEKYAPKIRNLIGKLINKIEIEKLINILVTVRKEENKENPDKYSFSNEKMLEIVNNSFNKNTINKMKESPKELIKKLI